MAGGVGGRYDIDEMRKEKGGLANMTVGRMYVLAFCFQQSVTVTS